LKNNDLQQRAELLASCKTNSKLIKFASYQKLNQLIPLKVYLKLNFMEKYNHPFINFPWEIIEPLIS
jgi:ABC-type uncharacterized transport system involved in gliding motility auxiliary subunit